jgi:DnaJ-class molecular chaperone
MTIEELWRKKGDQELEVAAKELAEYTEKAEQVIRAEISRRGLPEPPPTFRNRINRGFLDLKPLTLDAGINLSGQTQSTLEQEVSTLTQPLDSIADLRLDSQEAQLGGDVEIKFKHLEICIACQGQGCSYCGAQGTKETLKRLRITVPSGVKSGTNLRVTREGNNGGDLYLHVLVNTDETLREES